MENLTTVDILSGMCRIYLGWGNRVRSLGWLGCHNQRVLHTRMRLRACGQSSPTCLHTHGEAEIHAETCPEGNNACHGCRGCFSLTSLKHLKTSRISVTNILFISIHLKYENVNVWSLKLCLSPAKSGAYFILTEPCHLNQPHSTLKSHIQSAWLLQGSRNLGNLNFNV